MAVQIILPQETSTNHSVKISPVLSNLSSGMMMRRTGRRRHSGKTTGQCCPTLLLQLEVTTKTQLIRHTASSPSEGWGALTHSKDSSRHAHVRHESFMYRQTAWFGHTVRGLEWKRCWHLLFVSTHTANLTWSLFICHECMYFFFFVLYINIMFCLLKSLWSFGPDYLFKEEQLPIDIVVEHWSLILILPSGGNATIYNRSLTSVISGLYEPWWITSTSPLWWLTSHAKKNALHTDKHRMETTRHSLFSWHKIPSLIMVQIKNK